MSGSAPDFSVIVPTHGRPALVRNCLAALGRLDYPREGFEVILASDGRTGNLPAEPLNVDGLSVRVVTQDRAGPGVARNLGAASASGRWLAFTDDDCLPEPGWLRAFERALAEAPDALVAGRVVNGLGRNPFSDASHLLVEYVAAHARVPFTASMNFAIAAEEYRRFGGYDRSFDARTGEDRDFCGRWTTRGGVIRTAVDAVVVHRHDLDLAGFWSQHVSYGRGSFRFREREARRVGGYRFEPARFYLRLLTYPWARRGVEGPIPRTALLALSQVANATGFALEAVRATRRRRGRA